MWVTDLVTPVSTTDWDDAELGSHESTLNGTLDFLRVLPPKTDMAILITDSHERLKAGTLTGASLLLDALNLHNLVLQLLLVNELINDFLLLDRETVKENLLESLNLLGCNETPKLRNWNPFLFFLFGPTLPSASSTPGTTTSEAFTSSALFSHLFL
jgi:hypothetical protein